MSGPHRRGALTLTNITKLSTVVAPAGGMLSSPGAALRHVQAVLSANCRKQLLKTMQR